MKRRLIACCATLLVLALCVPLQPMAMPHGCCKGRCAMAAAAAPVVAVTPAKYPVAILTIAPLAPSVIPSVARDPEGRGTQPSLFTALKTIQLRI